MPRRTPRRISLSGPARTAAAAGIGLAVGLLLLALRETRPFEGLERRLEDVRTRHFAGSRGPDPRLVLCQIESEDVAWAKREKAMPWPWDLEYDAAIVRVLGAAGAKAVAVDILHLDRGAGPDDDAGGRDLTDAERQRLEIEAGSAESYGAALKETGRGVVAFELTGAPEPEVAARVAAALPRLGTDSLAAPPGALALPHARLPVRRVAEGAVLLGFVNVVPELDGVVRCAPVIARWGDRTVLSLAAATARVATGADLALDRGALVVGGVPRPLHPDGSFVVSYRGVGPSPYPRVSPAQVLSWADEMGRTHAVPAAARQALEGRIVVFGVNLPGLKDVVATPLGGAFDGPVLQATIVDDLLHGDGVLRAPRSWNVALLLVVTGFVGAAGASRRRWVPHAVALVAASGTALLGFLLFGRGTSLDLFTPGLGILLAWGTTTAVRLLTEGRYNRWLEGAFSRYLAPSVIAALKSDPSLLELGGHRRTLTVLFSDVAGFTTLSRRLAPEQLVALLNEYLTTHCDAVFRHGGVVDKFIGDAVMAFFGDPVPLDDHARRACRTALEVQAGLPALEPLWSSMGLPEFRVRIGVNSGPAVVGNMGSRQRFDYTVMGDTVNLASRLEGANKVFGTSVLIGSDTYEEARADVLAKPLASVVVVGWDRPVPVYELVAMRDAASPGLVAHVEAFRRAHVAARADDLAAAAAALDDAERAKPGDGPTAWLRGVVEALGSGREARPWSGVLVLSGK